MTLTLGLIVRDVGLSTLCHSCLFACQQRVLKTFPGHGYVHSEDGVVWIWHPLVNLCLWLTISFGYSWIPLAWGLMRRDGDLSNLCHSCRLACQKRVLKTFPGLGYLHSGDQVVWLIHPLENFYVWFTISFCYDSISLALGLIVMDGGLSTLCHSCELLVSRGS